jgi:hypothetical protein
MNVSFDSKYGLYFFASPKKCQRKATRKRYTSRFREGASIELCATVVNSSGSLMCS